MTNHTPSSRGDLAAELDRVFNRLADKLGIERQGYSIEYAKAALTALLTEAVTRGKLQAHKEFALDNYHGHTFSDSTDWQAKYDKFIQNNERRIKELSAQLKDKEGEQDGNT